MRPDASKRPDPFVRLPHRRAERPGSQPEQTQPSIWLSGTLEIAGQIATDIPALSWIAVTTRVVDRMEAFVTEIFDHVVQQGVALSENVPGATANKPVADGAHAELAEAGRVTDTGVPPRSEVPTVDGTPAVEEGSGDGGNSQPTINGNSDENLPARSDRGTNKSDRISRDVVQSLIADGLAHRTKIGMLWSRMLLGRIL